MPAGSRLARQVRQAVPVPGWQGSVTEGTNARADRKVGIGEAAGRLVASTEAVGRTAGMTEASAVETGEADTVSPGFETVGVILGCGCGERHADRIKQSIVAPIAIQNWHTTLPPYKQLQHYTTTCKLPPVHRKVTVRLLFRNHLWGLG
jgi:hypothetical protein